MVSAKPSPLFVEASLQIPGRWKRLDEFRESLPVGCQLKDGWLELPDGQRWCYAVQPAVRGFRQLFGKACRQPPSPLERQRIERATVRLSLCGPAGSRAAVARIMATVATVIRAGGAGVFIENSVIAHGGSDWLALARLENRDTGPFRALISLVVGEESIYTVGAHLFGCRDVVLPRSDDDERDLHQVMRYYMHATCESVSICEGDVLEVAELEGYRVTRDTEKQDAPPDWPMYNPFGRWRLEPPGG